MMIDAYKLLKKAAYAQQILRLTHAHQNGRRIIRFGDHVLAVADVSPDQYAYFVNAKSQLVFQKITAADDESYITEKGERLTAEQIERVLSDVGSLVIVNLPTGEQALEWIVDLHQVQDELFVQTGDGQIYPASECEGKVLNEVQFLELPHVDPTGDAALNWVRINGDQELAHEVLLVGYGNV